MSNTATLHPSGRGVACQHATPRRTVYSVYNIRITVGPFPPARPSNPTTVARRMQRPPSHYTIKHRTLPPGSPPFRLLTRAHSPQTQSFFVHSTHVPTYTYTNAHTHMVHARTHARVYSTIARRKRSPRRRRGGKFPHRHGGNAVQ